MGKVDVEIVFEDGERVFHGGDVVRGEVVVRARAQTRCKSLRLSLGWKTRGRGTAEVAVAYERMLFSGEWSPGEYRYAFAVQVTHGPYSYPGHYLQVSWFAGATADIPLARDPSCEEVFELKPSKVPVPMEHEMVLADTNNTALMVPGWTAAIVGSVVCVGSVVSLLLGATGIMALVALISAFAAGLGFKEVFARGVFADARVDIEPAVAWPDAPIDVRMSFTPKMNLDVNAVTLKLMCREVVISRGGRSSTRYEHVPYEASFELMGAKELKKGEPVHLERMVDLPVGAPTSFRGLNNTLEWIVEARVDVPNWPDWVDKVEFVVGDQKESSW